MTWLYTISVHIDGADIDVALERSEETDSAIVDYRWEQADEQVTGLRDDDEVRKTVNEYLDWVLE